MIARGAERSIIAIMILMIASVLLSYLISLAFAISLAIMLIIFRDPDVPIAPGVISPVDGKILSIDEKSKSILIQIDYLGKRVMRAPISGTLEDRSHSSRGAPRQRGVTWKNQGDDLMLFSIRSPNVNAKVSTLRQSRFAFYSRASRSVLRGDRMCLLPRGRLIRMELSGPSVEIRVKPGNLVLAGESTLATI